MFFFSTKNPRENAKIFSSIRTATRLLFYLTISDEQKTLSLNSIFRLSDKDKQEELKSNGPPLFFFKSGAGAKERKQIRPQGPSHFSNKHL